MTPQRLLVYLLIIAFVAAPFLGLLYGPETGLAILVAAIGLTLALIWPIRQNATGDQSQRLDLLIRVNALLLVLAGILLIVTLVA
jgi:uncharacterized membrane protein